LKKKSQPDAGKIGAVGRIAPKAGTTAGFMGVSGTQKT